MTYKHQKLDCEVLNLAIEPEHIHLFMNCPPDIAPSQIMHRIKGAWSQVFKERVSLFDEATKYVDKGIFCFNCWQCS